ncbi:MAG: DUF4388 domain-containing protein [bacterium]|nr:DUF4388 domain-containing protein [bacterium]
MTTRDGNRLDQILLRLGFVDEAQITDALQRQGVDGGRLGSHLMRAGAVTAEQLARALSEQYGVPAFSPGRHRVNGQLVAALPAELVRTAQLLPMGHDPSSGVLSVVAVDPEDPAGLAELRHHIQCADVEIFVTPEATFEGLLTQHLPADDAVVQSRPGIVLPDLFNADAAAGEDADPLEERDPEDSPEVLLVSDQAFLKNFLAPIFEREGLRLVTAGEPAEVAACLNRGSCERVLVPREMAAVFASWVKQGTVPVPRGEVGEFATVSGALCDNPVPYAAMHASLIQSLKMAAESHLADAGSTPPYDLLCGDCRELGAKVELSRRALDGLEAAVLLIVPSSAAKGADKIDDHGVDWPRTLGRARSLRHAWGVEDVLAAFRELLTENVNLEEFSIRDPEIALAAQVLALVWHHHAAARRSRARKSGDLAAVKSHLRGKSGRLAVTGVVESYLGLLEDHDLPLHAAAYHQLFVVGEGQPLLVRFAARLRHLGYHTVLVEDLDEARRMCDRHSPSAIFVHDDLAHGSDAGRELFDADSPVLVFALTVEREPARILELFDAGFDDVFALPHDFDIVAARVRKALQAHLEASLSPDTPGGFRAAFTALGFTDLLQVLSQSLKTVRITLAHGDQEAVVHLDHGRLCHAVCAGSSGVEAIYAIIAWEDDGEFTVEPVANCPADNVEATLESILMEGCRLLDESRV